MNTAKVNEALKKAYSEDLTVEIIRRHQNLYDEILADIGTASAKILDAADRGGTRFQAQTIQDVFAQFATLDKNVRLLDSLIKHCVFYVEEEEE